MNLAQTDRGLAQAVANRIHNDLIADSPLYAASVAAGQTLRWAIPYQEKDRNGNVIDPNWRVTVDERVRGVLTSAERANFPR